MHLLQAVVKEHLSQLLVVGLLQHLVVKGVNPIVQRRSLDVEPTLLLMCEGLQTIALSMVRPKKIRQKEKYSLAHAPG